MWSVGGTRYRQSLGITVYVNDWNIRKSRLKTVTPDVDGFSADEVNAMLDYIERRCERWQ